jgi:hypothetical protein
VSLLKVLKRTDVAVNTRHARNAAMVKFAFLGCALGYCVIGSATAAVKGFAVEHRPSNDLAWS